MDDSCFETLDQVIVQHPPPIDMHQTHEYFTDRGMTLEANPILPLHKGFELPSKVNFRMIMQQKTHQKQIKRRSLLPKIQDIGGATVSADVFRLSVKPQQVPDYYEFGSVLLGCKLVYKRIDNSQCNCFARAGRRYYCGMFIDQTTLVVQGQVEPVNLYEVLSNRFSSLPLCAAGDDLQFDSNFEGGNLFAAFKRRQNQYELLMASDINTKGSTQWYYFSVRNRYKGKVRFTILNFVTQYKQSSLYEHGMKPLAMSSQKLRRYTEDWKRAGQSVSYGSAGNTMFNKLTFVYDFEFPHDKVFFCYSFPYTLNDLEQLLQQMISTHPKIIKKQILCHTTLNYPLQMLTIAEGKNKPIIYVIARQHAGQSPGSFVMEGFLRTLLSNRIEAQQLRDLFTFKIVPMVNIDGVTVGNYRTNLSGNDINRKWDHPSKQLHPEVWYIKQKISEDRKNIKLFLDLHAHSRKMNSFFYGGQSSSEMLQLFPFICSRLNKDINKDDCSYGIDPGKRSTARAIVQNELQVKRSYTFEASFFGRTKNDGSYQHFQKSDLRDLGSSIVLGLFYAQVKIRDRQAQHQSQATVMGFNNSPPKRKNPSIGSDLNQSNKSQAHFNRGKYPAKQLKKIEGLTDQLYEKWLKQKSRLKSKNQKDDEQIDSIGSDSDPQEFLLTLDQIQQFEQYKIEQAQQNQQKQDKLETINSVIKKNIRQTVKYSNDFRSNKYQTRYDKSFDYSNQQNGDNQLNSSRTGFSTLSNLRDRLLIKQLAQESDNCHLRISRYAHPNESKAQQHSLDIQTIHQYSSRSPYYHNQHHHHYGVSQSIDSTANYQYNILELKKTMKFMMNIGNNQKSQLQNCFDKVMKNEKNSQNSESVKIAYLPLSSLNKKSNSLIRGRKTMKSNGTYFRKP